MRVRILSLVFFLSCWAAVSLRAAVDPSAGPVPQPGALEIALDPAAVSVLPIETEELKLNLCSGGLHVDGIGTISPRGECDLVVSPPPRLGLDLEDATPASGAWRVSLRPAPERSEAWEGSDAVETPCGLWHVSMVLDPDSPQPVSEVALETSAADPAQGTFAGALKLAVRYRFLNQAGMAPVELPATVSLDLTGHWLMASGLEDGASNLVLFARAYGDLVEGVPTCVRWGNRHCGVCVEPPPDVLDRLNSSLHP